MNLISSPVEENKKHKKKIEAKKLKNSELEDINNND